MELYNEENFNTSKKSKLPIILGVIIIFLTILLIVLFVLVTYLKNSILTITLDNKDISSLEEILDFEQSGEETKIYIPIRKIASYFEYEDYRGDYKYKSEDNTKCYVKNEYETAMFTLDSDIIIKTRGDSDYEYIKIDEKVFEKDGELYTTIDGIKKAYNVEFIYDSEQNNIKIYTMDYLLKLYASNLEYKNYSTKFLDKKAIFEDMIIVQQNGNYGVVQASTGKSILETKYESISYLPNAKDFLVKSNGKYGIMTKESTTKVNIAYDEIKIIDNTNGLYRIKSNNLYGVIDMEGNTIINIDYQQIGLNSTSAYSENGIENQYVILDKLIPIKNNNMWAFFDIEGNQVTEFEYTSIGCSTSKVANSYPVLVIPSYEIIIVQKDKYYNLMRINGEEIIQGYVLDSVYMKRDASTGKTNFYMTYNGNTEDVEERLSSLDI